MCGWAPTVHPIVNGIWSLSTADCTLVAEPISQLLLLRGLCVENAIRTVVSVRTANIVL